MTPWMHLLTLLIIIHRESEGFQEPAFAESAWKMVAAWQELLGAHKDGCACKPHSFSQPTAPSLRGEALSVASHPVS